MKKIKIIALIMTILTVLGAFCACSGKKSEKDLGKYLAMPEMQPPITQAIALAENIGTYTEGNGAVYLFTSIENTKTQYNVYNFKSNKVVFGASLDTLDSEVRLYPNSLFSVKNAGVIKLYDADGNLLAEANAATEIFSDLDTVVIGRKAFRTKNGALTEQFELSELAGAMPNTTTVTEKYRYNVGSSAVAVYNGKYELVGYFDIPEYVGDDANVNILNNGNLLVQYLVLLPSDAQEYDVAESVSTDGTENRIDKYDLVTVLFNVETGEARSINTNLMFYFVSNKNLIDGDARVEIADGVENIAVVAEIDENKRLDTSGAVKFVTVDNELNAKAYINDIFPTCAGFERVLSEDRYVVYDKLGSLYIIDRSGVIIGDISASEAITDSFVIGKSSIYDLDLKKLHDFAAEGKNYEFSTDSASIFSKENEGVVEYFVYTREGGMQSVGNNVAVTNVNGDIYCVRNYDDESYSYYNEKGNLIIKTDYALYQTEVTPNGEYLFYGTGAGGTVYYKLSK